MSRITRSRPGPHRWIRLIAGGAAALAAGGVLWTSASSGAPASAAARPADATVAGRGAPVPEGDLYDVRNQEDVVTAVFTKIPQAGQVQFVLHTVPGVTWWKQIRVVDQAGRTLPGLEDSTQDGKHHTKVLTLDRSAVEKGATLVYAKAKEFGAHTDRYEGRVPLAHLGHRIDITWQKDG